MSFFSFRIFLCFFLAGSNWRRLRRKKLPSPLEQCRSFFLGFFTFYLFLGDKIARPHRGSIYRALFLFFFKFLTFFSFSLFYIFLAAVVVLFLGGGILRSNGWSFLYAVGKRSEAGKLPIDVPRRLDDGVDLAGVLGDGAFHEPVPLLHLALAEQALEGPDPVRLRGCVEHRGGELRLLLKRQEVEGGEGDDPGLLAAVEFPRGRRPDVVHPIVGSSDRLEERAVRARLLVNLAHVVVGVPVLYAEEAPGALRDVEDPRESESLVGELAGVL